MKEDSRLKKRKDDTLMLTDPLPVHHDKEKKEKELLDEPYERERSARQFFFLFFNNRDQGQE